jgi:hypothetical protein
MHGSFGTLLPAEPAKEDDKRGHGKRHPADDLVGHQVAREDDQQNRTAADFGHAALIGSSCIGTSERAKPKYQAAV